MDTKFLLARELFESMSAEVDGLRVGPTFEELLEYVSRYVDERVSSVGKSLKLDVGMYYWRQQAYDILRTAAQDAPTDMVTVPILGEPERLTTTNTPDFKWPGDVTDGRKTHWSKVPCHGGLEVAFLRFLDGARDVDRFVKNERFGFSVTYYEANRARQYFPDFIVVTRDGDQDVHWLARDQGRGSCEHSSEVGSRRTLV